MVSTGPGLEKNFVYQLFSLLLPSAIVIIVLLIIALMHDQVCLATCTMTCGNLLT